MRNKQYGICLFVFYSSPIYIHADNFSLYYVTKILKIVLDYNINVEYYIT